MHSKTKNLSQFIFFVNRQCKICTTKTTHMQLITFKTNISNEKALQRVAPLLNTAVGAGNWQLDMSGGENKLMLYSPSIIDEMQVIDVVHQAGFYAVNIDDFYAIY
jgi:hypothetical protein